MTSKSPFEGEFCVGLSVSIWLKGMSAPFVGKVREIHYDRDIIVIRNDALPHRNWKLVISEIAAVENASFSEPEAVEQAFSNHQKGN